MYVPYDWYLFRPLMSCVKDSMFLLVTNTTGLTQPSFVDDPSSTSTSSSCSLLIPWVLCRVIYWRSHEMWSLVLRYFSFVTPRLRWSHFQKDKLTRVCPSNSRCRRFIKVPPSHSGDLHAKNAKAHRTPLSTLLRPLWTTLLSADLLS